MKFTENQKELIYKLRSGYSLFKNKVTPGAQWYIGQSTSYKWGNIHGTIVNGISDYLKEEKVDFAVSRYALTELGKTIQL